MNQSNPRIDDFDLELLISEGEGQTIEFKERMSGLDKEMVAFSNSSGGTVYRFWYI